MKFWFFVVVVVDVHIVVVFVVVDPRNLEFLTMLKIFFPPPQICWPTLLCAVILRVPVQMYEGV